MSLKWLKIGWDLLTHGFDWRQMVREKIIEITDQAIQETGDDLKAKIDDPASDWDEKAQEALELGLVRLRERIFEKLDI